MQNHFTTPYAYNDDSRSPLFFGVRQRECEFARYDSMKLLNDL